MSAQLAVGSISSLQLSDCDNWIPMGSWVCMLKLKVKERLMCLLQVNVVSKYEAIVNDVNDALQQRVGSTESTIIWGFQRSHWNRQ